MKTFSKYFNAQNDVNAQNRAHSKFYEEKIKNTQKQFLQYKGKQK